jgi:hypothetical protein
MSLSYLIEVLLTFISDDDIQLSRFKGKPGEMSPKARLHMFAGWLLPSRFGYVQYSHFFGTDEVTIQALNLRSIGTTGLSVGPRLVKKSDISSIIIQLRPSLMGRLSFR